MTTTILKITALKLMYFSETIPTLNVMKFIISVIDLLISKRLKLLLTDNIIYGLQFFETNQKLSNILGGIDAKNVSVEEGAQLAF